MPGLNIQPDDRYIILAPHVDDEVIGCYRLLKAGVVEAVYYYYEADEVRKDEAIAAGKKFAFEPMSGDAFKPTDCIVAIPNCRDEHPHHKKVNAIGKALPNERKVYYSVDMNVRKEVLAKPMQVAKEQDLKRLFPSQAAIWNSTEKYWLFESCLPTDLELSVTATTSFEGIHAFPAAPEEVAFLRHPHRHIFYVTSTLEVFHKDREVEFIMFKRWLDTIISNDMVMLKSLSCEMMAESLLNTIIKRYPGRSCIVTVSEDNENGSTVRYVL